MTEPDITWIDKPGIYNDMPASLYHQDPCPGPSLSRSIAHILLTKTPRHAWCAHPRLNPKLVREEKTEFNIGTAAHALLLEGEDKGIVMIDADAFQTKAAREARDAAYADGKVPLLPKHRVQVDAMVSAAKEQLSGHKEGWSAVETIENDVSGSEVTVVWQEPGTWCRARPDLFCHHEVLWDYKTQHTSAHPDQFARAIYDHGYDLQAAWCLRGWRKLRPNLDLVFRFIVQEKKPPYALSVIALPPAVQAAADLKCERALAMWRWCLERNSWPGYPRETCWLEPPAWEMAKFEEARASKDDPLQLEQLMDWQAP